MDDLKIVKGNTFETIIEVRAYTYKGQEIKDFDLRECTNISIVVHINGDSQSINSYDIQDDKRLVITWQGKNTKLGQYTLEARGKLNDLDWRFYDKHPIFTIVNTNSEANIPELSIIKDGCYKVTQQSVYLYNATTENKIDYIGTDNYVYKYDPETRLYKKSTIYTKGGKGDKGDKGNDGVTDYGDLQNKPSINNVTLIGNKTTQDLGIVIPANTSDLNNDSGFISQETDPTVPQWAKQSSKPSYTAQEVGALPADIQLFDGDYNSLSNKPDLSGFITASVDNLVNYYLKSETYTKTEVQTLVNTIKQFTYQVVSVLPEASASTMNIIYLVPSADPQTQNVKDEYITIENSGSYSWEQIGSTAIDLSGYYTAQQTDSAISQALTTALAGYTTTQELTQLLAAKQDVISDLAAIRNGAQSGATAYQKPNTGIPSTDLASAVQTSLGKADSALQSFTETDPTVPSWAKASSKPTYTASEVGALPSSTVIPTITFRLW